MVLIQFLRSLVRISAVWKSLIRAFKRYRGREENTKSDWERMVWTFECRFVDQVFVWWTGCSRPVTSDSSKGDFCEAVSKPFILTNKHVSWRFGEDFPSALSCKARLFFFCLEDSNGQLYTQSKKMRKIWRGNFEIYQNKCIFFENQHVWRRLDKCVSVPCFTGHRSPV